MSNKKLDAEIAVKHHGWRWSEHYKGWRLLIPPSDSEMRYWTGIWDVDGIPHFLPEYSKMDGAENES